MKYLVANVTTQTGFPPEQVEVVIRAVADYVKEKYPLLTGTIDMVLEQQEKSQAA